MEQSPSAQPQPTTLRPDRSPGAPAAGSPRSGLVHDGHGWTAAGAPLASAGKRLGAALLEGVLVVVTLGIGWLIWSFIVWSKGQTPAKSLLGMRCVITTSGGVAGWGTMFLREIVGKGLIGTITFGITSLVSCFMI